MSVAHKMNARVRQLPPCPECNAFEGCPCTTATGFVIAPHRARERVAAGELFVIRADDARAGHKLRLIRELAATLPKRNR